MKIIIFVLLIIYPIWCTSQTNELPRATPQSQGVSNKQLHNMFDSLMSLPDTEIHSVMVARHGKVIGEMYPRPFTSESMHTLYSCSKTFVGAAIGIAIAENRLRLSDRIATLLPEYLPQEITANLASITVRDLLTMSSGITPDWDMRNKGKDWAVQYLSKEVSTPGTKFQYDSICSYLLSVIIQKVTGQTTLNYLKEKIFTPLHINEVDWELSPEGYNTGGWGLRLQSESMMKFGLLLLNKGNWNGEQLIPESWIKEMTSKQFEAGNEDYGYQMWLCDYPGAIRADGAYGQYIILYPPEDIVVVVTQCSLINGMIPRHIIYNNLFKSPNGKQFNKKEEDNELTSQQQQYTLQLLKGEKDSHLIKRIENKTIKLNNNSLGWETIKIAQGDKKLYIYITDKNAEVTKLSLNHAKWTENIVNTKPPYSIQAVGRYNGIKGPFNVATSYAWNKNNLVIQIQYTDWISGLQIKFSEIKKRTCRLTIKCNYSSNPIELICTMI